MSAMSNPFAEQFATLRDTLPGSEAIRAQRLESFEQFASTGLPGRKLERWRYTDLSKLATAGFDWTGVAVQPRHPDSRLAELLVPVAGPQVVFVDGRFAPTLSRIPAHLPLELHTLTDGWDQLRDGFPAHPRLTGHPLALLNTAFTRDGVVVRAPHGSKAATPIVIAFLGATDTPAALQPRVVLDIGAEAEVEIILQFTDAPSSESWTNIVTEIRQGAGSKLSLTRVQEHGAEHTHTSLVTATLARDAALRLGCFELGGRTVRSDIDIKLEERGASAELHGAFLALDRQHIDNQILVDHGAGETRSRQEFRGIAGDRGHGVFSGKVIVRPDAQRIDARQRSDNLLLSKTAEIDTTPILEIYANDVKCSHGATVGELDAQHLFYLQARGIGAAAARALLTFAFANAALERVENATLRSLLAERVANRLPAHERWEHLVA